MQTSTPVAATNTIWVINLSIGLAVVGAMFLVYGAIMTTPVLYGSLLSLHASILGIPAGADLAVVAATLPHIPQSVFLAGCFLIVEGACLDVCRRLRNLHKA
ncbi:MAG: hypothetical protein AAB853_05935 [Patescibacteria group bacterium]